MKSTKRSEHQGKQGKRPRAINSDAPTVSVVPEYHCGRGGFERALSSTATPPPPIPRGQQSSFRVARPYCILFCPHIREQRPDRRRSPCPRGLPSSTAAEQQQRNIGINEDRIDYYCVSNHNHDTDGNYNSDNSSNNNDDEKSVTTIARPRKEQ